VLLHGLGTTGLIWDGAASVLAADRRVITPDLPGFGASAPAGPGFALDAVALRLARGLAAQGVRAPFDLVGHSLGGAVALTLAALRPRLVGRLVLVAPAGLQAAAPGGGALLGAGAEALFAMRRALAPLADLAWGRQMLLAFAADDGARLSAEQTRAMVGASAGAQRLSAALSTLAATDLRPLLAVTPAPLGLVWGERDRAVPLRVARGILAVRPEAPLELIASTGHVPMVERPDAFAAAVGRVLAQLPRTATRSAGRRRTVW
jgi:3-oxoadipate enol-lactonase